MEYSLNGRQNLCLRNDLHGILMYEIFFSLICGWFEIKLRLKQMKEKLYEHLKFFPIKINGGY